MSLPFPSANVFSSPEEVWAMAFHELGQRIRRHFVRSEPYHRALAYVQGLMSSIERKNGWQVTEEAGEVTPYRYPIHHKPNMGSQHFLPPDFGSPALSVIPEMMRLLLKSGACYKASSSPLAPSIC
jgi:hypothetical protein